MDGAGDSTAVDAAAFYEGETIRFLIPSAPGGGFDEYSRLLEQTPAGVRLRLQTLSLRGGPNARRTPEEWNEAWRDLLRRGESLALGERLLLWLAVAQVQLAER